MLFSIFVNVLNNARENHEVEGGACERVGEYDYNLEALDKLNVKGDA